MSQKRDQLKTNDLTRLHCLRNKYLHLLKRPIVRLFLPSISLTEIASWSGRVLGRRQHILDIVSCLQVVTGPFEITDSKVQVQTLA